MEGLGLVLISLLFWEFELDFGVNIFFEGFFLVVRMFFLLFEMIISRILDNYFLKIRVVFF